jgi:hypothetical protein
LCRATLKNGRSRPISLVWAGHFGVTEASG